MNRLHYYKFDALLANKPQPIFALPCTSVSHMDMRSHSMDVAWNMHLDMALDRDMIIRSCPGNRSHF